MGKGATYITVKNCDILNGYITSSAYGISISGATIGAAGDDNDNITIQNNAVKKAYYGIHALGSPSGLMNGLVITQNILGSSVAAEYIGYYAIYFGGADMAEITSNEVYNMITSTSTYQIGIEVQSNNLSPLIARNKIHDMKNNNTGGWGAYGINIGSGTNVSNVQIVNNLIYAITTINYSTSSTTYNPFGIRITGGTGHKIYHNSVHMYGTQFSSGSAGTLSAAFCVTSSSATGMDIRDNIFANGIIGLTGSQSFAIYAVAGTTFATINYNDYYGYGTYGVLGYLGSNQATLGAWQTATGQDGNSLATDPIFTSNSDLHPTNIALNNTGIYIPTVPADFDGNLRTNPPDFGAYNFGIDPVVNTTAATAITSVTATLNGTINAASMTVNSFFDYGLTTAYGTSVAATPATVTGITTTPISLGVSGLAPLTTYHYRARGVTTGGLIVYGPDLTFTTLPPPPTVITDPATAITTTGATLNGTVNANGSSTTVTFEYGLTASYGSTLTATQSPVGGSANTPVSVPVTGLQPNTLYHFRVVGTNAGGTVNGNDLTFTTAAAPPVVVTNPATNIGTTTATLNGTVTAVNSTTSVIFEWGLTPAFGNVAPGVPSPVTGNTATAVSANIIGLTPNTTYYFRCVGVNAGGTTNGATLNFLAGCPPVGAAGPITGPTSLCANSTGNVYSIAPIVNATGYAWTAPTGATITAGQNTTSITVTFGGTSGNVSVYGTSACGNGTPSNLAVTVNPLPVPTISGPASACQGSTGNVYTTQAGMTNYAWTVSPGGTITAGSGTNTITVTWNASGANSVSVGYTNANGCASATPGTYAVTVNTAPAPTITGPTQMCVNSGFYDYATQAGFTNYVWTISAGGTINYGQGTNTIQVSWLVAGPQWVAVNYTNSNGCSAPAPVQYAVTVDPLPGAAGTITGTATVCGGAMGVPYSVAPITGATAYVWTLPAGATIASGSGTNSITVDFAASASSGNITVAGNNLCGNGQPSPPFAVTVTPLPAAAGTITGMAAVCQGVSGVVYTVDPIANATGYVWTVPAGATIVAGNNTNSITVDFSLTASSGSITVYGTNSCGNGTVSPAFNVTVNPIPPAPVITLMGTLLMSDAPAGNQWYFNGGPIPGATQQTYEPTQTGTYWAVVTLNGCSSDSSNNIYVVITGTGENSMGSAFTVHPNPNDGQFTVHLEGMKSGIYTIEVINNLGVTLWKSGNQEIAGNRDLSIDIRPVPAGVYTVVLRNQSTLEVRRILVRY